MNIEKEKDELGIIEKETEKSDSYMALGLLIGFALATIGGFCLMDTLAYGPIGMALGMVVGMNIKKSSN